MKNTFVVDLRITTMQVLAGTSTAPQTVRDTALDGLRAIAIIRVITWHASGWAWTTWFVSSVPAMFVITGALLAKSFEKKSVVEVLRHRFLRLLPPLWVYCLLVFALSFYFETKVSSRWTFIFPLEQPSSDIAGYWFTSALWYLRAYVWVLLLSPILFHAVRKFRSLVPTFGILSVILIGLLKWDTSNVGWIVGDVVLYATCTAAGMTWLSHERPSPRSLRLPMIGIGLSAMGWAIYRMPPEGVVNNDHVLHLLLGGFWTLALMSLPGLLERIAATKSAKLLNHYSLSVYLWHSITAWYMWQLMPNELPTTVRTVVIIAATFLALPFVIYAVGLFESRNKRWFRLKSLAPRFLVVFLIVGLINTPTLADQIDYKRVPINQPLPPSAAPKIVTIQIDPAVQKFLDSQELRNDQRDQELQRILEQRNQEMNLGAVRAVVIAPDGHTWSGVAGEMKSFDQPSLIGSLTKTFTTTLVMRLVEEGKLSLDSPIGDLGLDFSHTRITIRQLLSHTSGLVEYKNKAGSVEDGTTPLDVLKFVSNAPLAYSPGTFVQYTTAGYVVLGIILERTTGRTFEELVQKEIAEDLNYDLSLFRGEYRSIGFSTGGISMKMQDLADWSRRYFYDRTTTNRPWKWDIKKTTGLGVHGYCPCINSSFMALGHIGGRTFASVDGDGTVVIIDTIGVLVLQNYKATQTFAQELRLVAGGGKTPLYK